MVGVAQGASSGLILTSQHAAAVLLVLRYRTVGRCVIQRFVVVVAVAGPMPTLRVTSLVFTLSDTRPIYRF